MQMQSQVCTVTVKISLIVFWISIKGREVPVNKMVDSNCKTNVTDIYVLSLIFLSYVGVKNFIEGSQG